jgi:hypothetical protein
MATISITIPDGSINDVKDAFAAIYGWTAESGLTKAQFAKKKVADYTKDVLKEYKAQQAGEAARQSIDTVDIN